MQPGPHVQGFGSQWKKGLRIRRCLPVVVMAEGRRGALEEAQGGRAAMRRLKCFVSSAVAGVCVYPTP